MEVSWEQKRKFWLDFDSKRLKKRLEVVTKFRGILILGLKVYST